MTLATYAELKTAISDTLARDDLTDTQLSGFIRMAEAQMSRQIRHVSMETLSTISLTSRFYTLPADWVETIRLHLPDQPGRIELVGHAALQDMRVGSETAGVPRFYAYVGGDIDLYPVPDATYSAELLYYAAVPALSDTNTSNWLLTAAPDAYLYGALIHSAPLLQEDARIAVWAGMFTAAVGELNAASNAAKWSGTGLRKRMRG